MSSFEVSDFIALDLSGDNWLGWAINTAYVLTIMGLGQCITQGNPATESDKERAITYMRLNLTSELKDQYAHVEDPRDLWTELKSRYTKVLLPKVKFEWIDLRLKDFESVEEYDSELSKIVSKLRLCGETITEKDLLEKTLSSMKLEDTFLQYALREKGLTTYDDLFAHLQQAEMESKRIKEKSEAAISKIRDRVASLLID